MTLRRRPDLGSLELLLAVAELGSVGKAARLLGTTQASASRRLDTLERELGLTLLARSTTGSRLTTHGHLVSGWARATLDAADDMLTGVEALRHEREVALRVAASMTVGEYLMPGWLMAFRRRCPEVRVSLRIANSVDVASLVRTEQADVGFIEAPTAPDDLQSVRVAADRLVVVVAPMHPWAGRRQPLGAAELRSTRLVVREPGSGTRTALERALGPGMAEPLLELASNAAIKVAVVSGEAPAVLSDLAVQAELRDGRLVEVPVDGVPLVRPLRALWRGPHTAHEPGRTLIGLASTAGA